jgi:hypothetical protein
MVGDRVILHRIVTNIVLKVCRACYLPDVVFIIVFGMPKAICNIRVRVILNQDVRNGKLMSPSSQIVDIFLKHAIQKLRELPSHTNSTLMISNKFKRSPLSLRHVLGICYIWCCR